jgi:hypothetical protein
MAAQSRIAEIVANPFIFAITGGVANGVLAAVRDKPVSMSAAWITALTIAAGELALVYELPEAERPSLGMLFAHTVAGTFVGMAPFISWQKGQKSWLQQAAEAGASRVPLPAPQPAPVRT